MLGSIQGTQPRSNSFARHLEVAMIAFKHGNRWIKGWFLWPDKTYPRNAGAVKWFENGEWHQTIVPYSFIK